jgi:hypothetical protein
MLELIWSALCEVGEAWIILLGLFAMALTGLSPDKDTIDEWEDLKYELRNKRR